MKKGFLLLAAGLLAISAGAQERQIMNVPGAQPTKHAYNAASIHAFLQNKAHSDAAHKTTGGSRWYNYCNSIDSYQYYTSGGSFATAVTTQVIWKDTFGIVNFTSGPAHNEFVSQADIFDPKAIYFNTATIPSQNGQIFVRPSDGYTCDSAVIFGVYHFNQTKTTEVDTLRLMFCAGNGGSMGSDNIFGGSSLAGGGHYGAVGFLDMAYDTVHNRGTGPSVHYQDIYLTSADWGDTLTDGSGIWFKQVAVNPGGIISAGAGGMLGMTVSFITGDPTAYGAGILHHLPGDSLFYSTATYLGDNKYNVWEPLIDFYGTSSASGDMANFAPYNVPADNNGGLWKTLPDTDRGWGGIYIPLWGWTSGSGAATLQFPEVAWHITCSSCLNIVSESVKNAVITNSINTYPNPATEELNIAFGLNQTADVSVTLTNMIGQVVATQHISNVTTGKAVFNTATLPEGIYVFNLVANGERSAGQVVIAH